MNIYIVVKGYETEHVQAESYEHQRIIETLDDPDESFLVVSRDGRQVMINKDYIVKVWWEETKKE